MARKTAKSTEEITDDEWYLNVVYLERVRQSITNPPLMIISCLKVIQIAALKRANGFLIPLEWVDLTENGTNLHRLKDQMENHFVESITSIYQTE